MGSMCVQLAALLAPNQDIAFVLAAGYVAASILTGGFIVSFNSFYKYSKWLQWTSFIKFTFQPLSMNVLRGKPSLPPSLPPSLGFIFQFWVSSCFPSLPPSLSPSFRHHRGVRD